MGAVCPCLAGVDKAAGKPAAAAPKAAETQPLLPKTAAPTVEVAAPEPKKAPAVPPAAPDAKVAPAPAPTPAPAPAKAEATPEPAVPALSESIAALIEAQAIGIGSCLEIYSNSYQAWCPGVIYGLDSTSVLVAYQVPGEPADANISTKTLPMDSAELQMPTETGAWLTASVEVYSHSNKAWCLGRATENKGGVLSVVFFYPNEPADAVPVMKQLPLGDKDLRLRGIDSIFQANAGLGHETLEVNSPVEVYSNSLGVWCPGIVQDLNHEQALVVVAFFYPDQDPATEEPAVKELPLGHQDLRVPGVANEGAYNTGPPVTEADLKVGGQIDVFSQSRQVWITSVVKDVRDGNVTVQLRYPDMPADSELYEKVIPVGHQDLRIAQ